MQEPILDGPKIIHIKEGKKAKVCPQCHSFFITDQECESCGLQFKRDLFQGAFGDKSTYALKEEYVASLPFWYRLWAIGLYKQSPMASNYARNLLVRLHHLIKEIEHQRNPQLLPVLDLELTALLSELKYLEIPTKRVLGSIETTTRGSASEQKILNLYSFIKASSQEQPIHYPLFQSRRILKFALWFILFAMMMSWVVGF